MQVKQKMHATFWAETETHVAPRQSFCCTKYGREQEERCKKRRGEYKCFIVHTDKWPKCDSIVNFWPHCAAEAEAVGEAAVESEAVGAATMQLYALIPAQFNDSGRSQCNLHA